MERSEHFEPILVAVYGSLRHGLHNHGIITKCEIVSIEKTPAIYEMRSLGGFPGVFLDGDKSILLEIYKVEDQMTADRLDQLEGYPRFYDKKLIALVDGREAWIYYLHDDPNYAGLKVVEDGDWFNFIK